MKLIVAVMYSCPRCALKDVEVMVPAREAEDVVAWMNQTVRYVGRDHSMRSRGCGASTVDLKIPMPAGTDRVGGAPVQ